VKFRYVFVHHLRNKNKASKHIYTFGYVAEGSKSEFINKISVIIGPRCPEGSRKLRFPDYVTMAQDGGKVVSLTHRSLLPPGNTPGTHFC